MKPHRRPRPRPAGARGRWLPALAPVLIAALVALGWLVSRAGSTPPDPAPATASAASAPATAAAPDPAPKPAGTRAPLSAQGLAERQAQLALWQQRLERATQTLAAYRAQTRYPFDSRPAREHPDQLDPRAPIEEDKPLRLPMSNGTPGVHVKTTQERVFASGDDTVRFTLSVVDDDGRVLPMRVLRSVAHEPADNRVAGQPTAPYVSLPFVDDGSQGDAQAGDGIYSATLRPALQGFAGFPGTIRTEVTLQVGEAQGLVSFDVVFAPGTPARWAGTPREAIEGGSLSFHLGLDVQQPGRYVVTGRVDDANGQPFALLNFNQELGTGLQDIRLTAFGRLVRDLKPTFPLILRDVDGFLLKPDTYPDRALLPRLDGRVLSTRRYALAGFSDAEWSSEERDRYLTEYGKDVSIAQAQVDRLRTGP